MVQVIYLYHKLKQAGIYRFFYGISLKVLYLNAKYREMNLRNWKMFFFGFSDQLYAVENIHGTEAKQCYHIFCQNMQPRAQDLPKYLKNTRLPFHIHRSQTFAFKKTMLAKKVRIFRSNEIFDFYHDS